jgi:hypothetical protein
MNIIPYNSHIFDFDFVHIRPANSTGTMVELYVKDKPTGRIVSIGVPFSFRFYKNEIHNNNLLNFIDRLLRMNRKEWELFQIQDKLYSLMDN